MTPTLAVAEPSSTLETVTSVAAVLAGAAGIAIAWAIYAEKRLEIPKLPTVQRLLEHKFYFDEAYDAAFYAPAVFLAKFLGQDVEQPLIADSGRDLGEDTRDLGGIVARSQTGLVRTYALAIASSVAVLAIVFVVVK